VKIREDSCEKLAENLKKMVQMLGKVGDLGSMTKKGSLEFLTDEIGIFFSFGERIPGGNLSVEMCSDEFSLEHALHGGSDNVQR